MGYRRSIHPHTAVAHSAKWRESNGLPTVDPPAHSGRTQRLHTAVAHSGRTQRSHTAVAHSGRTQRSHTAQNGGKLVGYQRSIDTHTAVTHSAKIYPHTAGRSSCTQRKDPPAHSAKIHPHTARRSTRTQQKSTRGLGRAGDEDGGGGNYR
jgi:hypothetical protein